LVISRFDPHLKPAWPHNQQHDPADRRKRSDCRRNKVVFSGLKAHSEKFDRLSRGRESDARVSEDHEAEDDQNEGNGGFMLITNLQFALSG